MQVAPGRRLCPTAAAGGGSGAVPPALSFSSGLAASLRSQGPLTTPCSVRPALEQRGPPTSSRRGQPAPALGRPCGALVILAAITGHQEAGQVHETRPNSNPQHPQRRPHNIRRCVKSPCTGAAPEGPVVLPSSGSSPTVVMHRQEDQLTCCSLRQAGKTAHKRAGRCSRRGTAGRSPPAYRLIVISISQLEH